MAPLITVLATYPYYIDYMYIVPIQVPIHPLAVTQNKSFVVVVVVIL